MSYYAVMHFKSFLFFKLMNYLFPDIKHVNEIIRYSNGL